MELFDNFRNSLLIQLDALERQVQAHYERPKGNTSSRPKLKKACSFGPDIGDGVDKDRTFDRIVDVDDIAVGSKRNSESSAQSNLTSESKTSAQSNMTSERSAQSNQSKVSSPTSSPQYQEPSPPRKPSPLASQDACPRSKTCPEDGADVDGVEMFPTDSPRDSAGGMAKTVSLVDDVEELPVRANAPRYSTYSRQSLYSVASMPHTRQSIGSVPRHSMYSVGSVGSLDSATGQFRERPRRNSNEWLPSHLQGLSMEEALKRGLKKHSSTESIEGQNRPGLDSRVPEWLVPGPLKKLVSSEALGERFGGSDSSEGGRDGISSVEPGSVDHRQSEKSVVFDISDSGGHRGSNGNLGMNERRRMISAGGLKAMRESALRQGRGWIYDAITKFLDDPESSSAAKAYGYFMTTLILCGVLLPIAQSPFTRGEDPFVYGTNAAIVEISIECIFLTELVLRFIASSRPSALLLLPLTYIDAVGVLPLIVRIRNGMTFDVHEDNQIVVGVLICAVPMVRMLKFLRRFEKFLLLQHAFFDAAEALPVLLYTLITIALFFSCVIYLVEPRDNMGTLPEAMWFTFVTMTTVGYGDMVPESGPGYLVTAGLIGSSALYMAMPLGIIGSAFTNVWKQRDCILLVKRAKDAMNERGYTAVDIPCLFEIFDSDNDGELSRGDFIRMIESMNVNLPTERVIALFDAFDSDGGGSIDAIEFIRHVFPKAFQELYGCNATDSDDDGEEEEDEDNDGDVASNTSSFKSGEDLQSNRS